MNAEQKRLKENIEKKKHWKKWGPYVSEREWGTVREDTSDDGEIWSSFPFGHAHMRAYQWGEDAIAGLCDNHQLVCFAFAFWNEKDTILKERLFGLSGPEGNHAEDVKEHYYYLDNLPTHAYMKYLYKYPQTKFPYEDLVANNQGRSQREGEFELLDTGIFDEDKYFDIFIEYAKEDEHNTYARLTIHNRGPDEAPLHILPTLWARNLWHQKEKRERPQIRLRDGKVIDCEFSGNKHYTLQAKGNPDTLFTENETNTKKLWDKPNETAYTKDGFHDYIIDGNTDGVNLAKIGTKAAFHYKLTIPAGKSEQLTVLFSAKESKKPFEKVDKLFEKRKSEADEFYKQYIPQKIDPDLQNIHRQALAGMLWNKQYYNYEVEEWLERATEENQRNDSWFHLHSEDVMTVPDKWEFPGFFSWDTAFHTLIFGKIDPEFAKRQLMLLTREWYMHPNGQLPAYEWDLSDVNPPVHAWATWRVYKIDKKQNGKGDLAFLEAVFQKLLINFTWWVNREDEAGHNIFTGGFLGLDNISVFNRSGDIPAGGTLFQSDATSWMGMYCLNMLTIALELAETNSVYEDLASKFYEHFIHISKAVNLQTDGSSVSLWNEEDGFFYDTLLMKDGTKHPLKVHSLVGLMPMLSIETIKEETINKLPGFKKRMDWFIEHRPEIVGKIASMMRTGENKRRLLALLPPNKLQKLLQVMLAEDEFLSPHGIRSLSKRHGDKPFVLEVEGKTFRVEYEPGESTNRLYGGNSNWRGPIWFPINFLIIESLQKFHHYYGDDFKVEYPTGSGKMLSLWEVSTDLSKRLVSIFARDENGRRPVFGENEKLQTDPHFRDYILFNEYFHGDTGAGLGASHQLGWTGLVAKLILQLGTFGEL
jgi:glycogen debranching enzyme